MKLVYDLPAFHPWFLLLKQQDMGRDLKVFPLFYIYKKWNKRTYIFFFLWYTVQGQFPLSMQYLVHRFLIRQFHTGSLHYFFVKQNLKMKAQDKGHCKWIKNCHSCSKQPGKTYSKFYSPSCYFFLRINIGKWSACHERVQLKLYIIASFLFFDVSNGDPSDSSLISTPGHFNFLTNLSSEICH